jgi:pseudouridine synthase
VRRFLRVKPHRLTRAALETLSIIAYRQPVTRPEIEDVRGVDSGAVVKALLERRLIKILGKKDEVGRPILYGTTREFLEFFALKDLSALPTLREFHELSEEHRTLVDPAGPANAEGMLEELGDPLYEQGLEEAAPGAEEAMDALEQAMEEAEARSKAAAASLGASRPCSTRRPRATGERAPAEVRPRRRRLRRHAELITAGRVSVNNQPVTELGSKVEPSDLVMVDGQLISVPERTSWYLLHKPPGVVTTLSDPQGRPTVAGLLEGVEERVFPVGRLDWDAEGALLLTNDGGVAHRLLHPSFEVPRTYLVKVKGKPTDETLARLREGVRLEDGPARTLRAERFEATERNTWLLLQVGEGRPHLIKRLCAAVGHPVVRLFRPGQAGVSVAGLEIEPASRGRSPPRRYSGSRRSPRGTVPEATPFLPPGGTGGRAETRRRRWRPGGVGHGRALRFPGRVVAPREPDPAPGPSPRGGAGGSARGAETPRLVDSASGQPGELEPARVTSGRAAVTPSGADSLPARRAELERARAASGRGAVVASGVDSAIGQHADPEGATGTSARGAVTPSGVDSGRGHHVELELERARAASDPVVTAPNAVLPELGRRVDPDRARAASSREAATPNGVDSGLGHRVEPG